MTLDAFVTARLSAARITPSHFDDLCVLHRDPRVMKTLSAEGIPLSDEVTRDTIRQSVDHWEQHGFGVWVFRERSSGQFVGRGGLKHYQVEAQPEIGLLYAVVAEQWGRGFATEMAAASLRIGFEQLDFPSIASWTLPHNIASQRVMEKLGFRYERPIEFAGLPHRLYRLAAAEFISS